jgi:hypothetical protein
VDDERAGHRQEPPRSLGSTLVHIVLVGRGFVTRGLNRVVVRPFRRKRKLVRERVKNTLVAARVWAVRQWRRTQAVPRRTERQVRVWGDDLKRARTHGHEWRVEREIGRIVSGKGPILVGPWLSEVGYEVLYWVPFVRWVQSHYGVKASRMTIVTRGGAAAWYRDISTQSVEVFDLVTPEEFAQGNLQRAAQSGGSLKQWKETSFDRELLEAAARRAGVEGARVLHPSLMYRLFEQFMLGHRSMHFLRRRTIYRILDPPDVPLPELPEEYVAVKLYTAASLPDTPAMRRTLQAIILALAERWPVVMLDTGLALDDHDDYTFERASRIIGIRDSMQPRDNLAVQSAVIARSRAFVGTCGSLAWLAPMMGVDTTALLADPRFLHGHLQVGRQMFQAMGGGAFSPLDVSALDSLGLTIANARPRSPVS